MSDDDKADDKPLSSGGTEAPDTGALPTADQADADGGQGPAHGEPKPKTSSEKDFDNEWHVAPDELERRVPKDLLRALGGYSVDELNSSGAAAFGPGATAFSLKIPSRSKPYWVRAVDEAVMNDVLEWYVPTEADGRLAKLLDGQGLACLAGLPGTGRVPTAQAVLASRHGAGQVKLIDFAQGGSPRDLLGDVDLWRGGCGYVLRIVDGPLTWRDLTSLRVAARRYGSTIVIVSSPLDSRSGTENYYVQHQPPNSDSVFWKHLDVQLRQHGRCHCSADQTVPCAPRCRTMLLDLCRASDDLAGELSKVDGLGMVVGLAGDIVSRWPDNNDDLTAILGGTYRHTLQQARQCLAIPDGLSLAERRRGAQRQVYLISYAVLMGCSMTLVADAAKLLSERVDPSARQTAPELQIQGFGEHVSQLIPEYIRPDANGHDGPPTEELAGFKDQRMVQALLEVVWEDYPSGHGALLEWLEDLAFDRRAQVRRSAATVTAFFARYAPETVFTNLINLWACSRWARRRQAAALVCAVAAEDKRLRSHVVRYLHQWRRSGSPRFLDTIARAYIVGLGKHVPHARSIQDITKVAQHRDLITSGNIALALATLAETVGVTAVVSVLSSWVVSKQQTLSTHAASVVPYLAGMTTETDRVVQPNLLSWMGTDVARRDELSELWRHSLLFRGTAFDAWKALGSWVEIAGIDEPQAERLYGLVATICRDQVFRNRLEFYLERVWPSADSPFHNRLISLAKG